MILMTATVTTATIITTANGSDPAEFKIRAWDSLVGIYFWTAALEAKAWTASAQNSASLRLLFDVDALLKVGSGNLSQNRRKPTESAVLWQRPQLGCRRRACGKASRLSWNQSPPATGTRSPGAWSKASILVLLWNSEVLIFAMMPPKE